MKILYIGETATHDQYLKGNVPSHWFYGAVEMERNGHEVIWAQEKRDLMNDLNLIYKSNPDYIFIPNLNLRNHLILLMLSSLGIMQKPVYAYLHHEPGVKRGLKSVIYKFLLRGISHLFFLSELSLQKTVESGLLDNDKCSVPGWGPDMDFYEKVDKCDDGWFVSTGKENRDFDTLIEAFRITGAPLHIITARSHAGACYEDLTEKCKGVPNIKVTILDNSASNYPLMVREMASSHALVCPLRTDRLNYCVGLSTIADAEGLGKPLVLTDNPYHGSRAVENDCFSVVTGVNDWIDAINLLKDYSCKSKSPTFTMGNAYRNMAEIMNL